MGAAIVAAVVVLVTVAIAPLLGKPARATIFFVVALFITESGMGARERPKVSRPTAQETVGIAASTDYDQPSLPHDTVKNSAPNLPPESQYSNLAFNNRKTMVAAMATLASSELLCGKKLSSREWQEAGVFALIFGYRVHDPRFRQDVAAKARGTSSYLSIDEIRSTCSYAEVLKDAAHKVYIAAEETLSTLPQ